MSSASPASAFGLSAAPIFVSSTSIEAPLRRRSAMSRAASGSPCSAARAVQAMPALSSRGRPSPVSKVSPSRYSADGLPSIALDDDPHVVADRAQHGDHAEPTHLLVGLLDIFRRVSASLGGVCCICRREQPENERERRDARQGS
jgi:hypothetical protein